MASVGRPWGFGSDPLTGLVGPGSRVATFILVLEPRFRCLWKKALNDFIKRF